MSKIHKVLLAGAIGFIGRSLTMQLRQAGYEVRPLARSLGQDFNRMLSARDWMLHLHGIDAVINAVGIIGETRRQRFETLHRLAPTALFSAGRQTDVRRIIQISALGADAPSVRIDVASPWEILCEYGASSLAEGQGAR